MVLDNYNASEIDSIYESQRVAFYQGITKSVSRRKTLLKQLKRLIHENEQKIFNALQEDLRKSEAESLMSETAFVLAEIEEALREVDFWAKPERVDGSWLTFPSKSVIYKDPYGIALIIGPWNYPFQLIMAPLVAAIAAGNTVVLKPSEISSATSQLLAELIDQYFAAKEIAVVQGGVETTQYLLSKPNDKIFFTGSPQVGKVIMKAAAAQLTPVTLELGGKSPVIVDETASVESTAKKIIFGKCLNAGQTCIAPDYLLVHASQKEALVAALKQAVSEFYGENPQESNDYARIINEKHFHRLKGYLTEGTILFGGDTFQDDLYVAPTVIEVTNPSASLMKEEIFGPILPLITYTSIDEVIDLVRENNKPLALYLFSKNKKLQQQLIESLAFGGGAINTTIEHIINPNLPFGGVGTSGLGAYHGKFGFEAFSHQKSVLKKSNWLDLPIKYPPYHNKMKWLRKAFKWA